MPPIPKFAKEMVKRAKAKPTVIKTSAVVKKVTNTMPQKLFGKNPTLPDIKDEKIDKEKLKKSLLWRKY